MNALINALNHGGELWWRYALHVAWQATLLALIVLIVVRLARRWPSPLRYWLLIIALMKFAMPPLLHAPVGLFSQVGPQLAPRQADQPVVMASAETLPVPDVGTAPVLPLPDPVAAQPSVVDEAVESHIPEESADAEVAADLAPPPVAVGETTQSLDENAQQPGPAVVASTDHSTAPVARARLRWQAWLLVAHVLGVLGVAAWTLWQLLALRRTVRRAHLVTDGELYERFVGLWRAMSLRRPPRLLVSPEPIAPMVVGVVRPTVVVPAAAKSLGGGDLDAMLTHELAHVRRRDTWLNWFQIIVVAVWWFNPVIWLLNRAIRKVREDCCDDLVLSRGHSTDDAYCQTLLHAASRLAVSSPIGARLGFADRLHPLGRRIRRIMDRTLRRAPALSLWGVVLVALLAVVLLPGLGRRGETTEPETEKQTEQAESQEPALEPAESSARTPELDKLEMEVAAQEKALADQFEAAADLKHKQIESIEARRKTGMLSNRQVGEQIAQIVRETAENRLRAAELRLSAAERELSILRLSVPPGGALPDAAREKTEKTKSLRSEVKSKQYDLAAGIDHVVGQREDWIKEVQAKLRAGLVPETEANIEIVDLQLLNTQDKILAAKLRYLADANLTYSADVLDIETRRAVVEPGPRSGTNEVLHWETLLLRAKAELIRHEDDWGPEHPKRKAQEKIIALYEAKLELARKRAQERAEEAKSDEGQEWKILVAEQKKLIEDYGAQFERMRQESGAAKVLAEQVAYWDQQATHAEIELAQLRSEFGEEHNRVKQQLLVVERCKEKLNEARKHAAEAAAESNLSPAGRVEPGSRPELNDALLDAAKEGNLAGVTSLIQRGAYVSTRDDKNNTPLDWALVNDYEEVALYLIEHGADVNAHLPLYWAATRGHQKAVELLIAKGADLDAGREDGDTPFVQAVVNGHADIARLLLDKGAHLDIESLENRGILNRVAGAGYLDCARLLIDKGVDPNAVSLYRWFIGAGGERLAEFGPPGQTPLMAAAGTGQTDMLRLLIESGAALDAAATGPDHQPLFEAVESGQIKAVALLLDKGADPNTRDSRGQHLLHLALDYRTPRVGGDPRAAGPPAKEFVPQAVRLLLEHRADVNARDARARTPLHSAVRESLTDVVKILIAAGADVEARTSRGETPLRLAIEADNTDSVRCLLEANADPKSAPRLEYVIQHSNTEIVKLLLEAGADVQAGEPLAAAVQKRSTEMVKLLLDRGTDPNRRLKNGQTLLEEAAKAGRLKSVELLLDAGADVNSGQPLAAAAQGANEKLVELLLNRGADPNRRSTGGVTPLQNAARHGNVEVARLLLNAGADVNARDASGYTALHFAASQPQLEVTVLLLGRGADPNLRDTRGNAPLHKAIENDRYRLIQLLASKGADVEARDQRGRTPLTTTAAAGDIEAIKILLATSADANGRDRDDHTPLGEATRYGHKEAVDALLAAGADTNLPSAGSAPLLLTVSGHEVRYDIVAALIAKGADINTKDSQGNTALHLAIRSRAEELVKMLLAGGVDINAADTEGCTPLHRALAEGDEVMAKMLLEGGADINAKDKDNYTPLHRAAQAAQIDVVNFLLTAGADVEGKAEDGTPTPLYLAALAGREEVVKLLLAKGANPNAKSKTGRTPLFGAVRAGHEEIVRLLLAKGADPNARDNDGRTVLFWEVSQWGGAPHLVPDPEMALVLIAAGADVNAQDNEGNTPLHMAVRLEMRAAEAVQLLLDKGADQTRKNNDGHTPRDLAVDPRVRAILDAAAGKDKENPRE